MSIEDSFQKLLEENPGIALIPKEDVSKIKIKMGKSHRKSIGMRCIQRTGTDSLIL